MDIKSAIREIPDWPIKGVNFKDITPLLQDKNIFRQIIDSLTESYVEAEIDKVVGIDARGFLLASAVAYKLNCGLALVRKKGKLPRRTVSREYALEYGSNAIEMHKDAILSGDKVLMVDDVLATGGTMKAAIELVKELKGKVAGVEFLIELGFLKGRETLEKEVKCKINSLARY